MIWNDAHPNIKARSWSFDEEEPPPQTMCLLISLSQHNEANLYVASISFQRDKSRCQEVHFYDTGHFALERMSAYFAAPSATSSLAS